MNTELICPDVNYSSYIPGGTGTQTGILDTNCQFPAVDSSVDVTTTCPPPSLPEFIYEEQVHKNFPFFLSFSCILESHVVVSTSQQTNATVLLSLLAAILALKDISLQNGDGPMHMVL